MNKLLLSVAVLGASVASASANAMPVTHYLTAQSQGQYCTTSTCSSVAAERSDVNAIDAGVAGFYSLGIDGSLTFDVSPQTFGSDLFVIEITNNTPNPNYAESALLTFSGLSGTEFIEISNQSTFVLNSSSGITAIRSAGGDSNHYTLTLSGAFSQLVIEDTTFDNYGGLYANTANDGFDIGELQFTAVPEPGAIGLLGLSLIGLAAIRRRKA